MKRAWGLSVLTILAAAFFLSCGPAWGQAPTTSLSGVVTDQSGAGVPGAKVTVTDKSTGYMRQVTSDATGVYQFSQLPPATYDLKVSAPAFKTFLRTGLVLLVAEPATVNVKLEIGAVNETVTVTETTAPMLNTTDATIGNAFNTKTIEALPFEGRDPTGILSLQPGVTYISQTIAQQNENFDSRSGAVNGTRQDQSDITLDGVDNNDQIFGNPFQGALRTTLESTREFRVTTTNGNADVGRSAGGQINLVTKSGTNQFHGSLYEYNRNIWGRANTWFNKFSELSSGLPNKPGALIRNTYGGALGGPILKNRLFFYFNYEAQRTRENRDIGPQVVPTASLRDGVITYLCAIPAKCSTSTNVTGLDGKSFTIPSGYMGLDPAQIAKMDPNCTTNGTCPLGPGVNSAVIQTLNLYPLPNNNTAGDGFNFSGFTFSAGVPANLNTSIVRLDYNVTGNGDQTIFFRGNLQDDRTVLSGPQFPGQPPNTVRSDTDKGFALGYTAVLGPNKINSFRWGYVRGGFIDNGNNNSTHIVSLRGLTNPQGFFRTTAVSIPVQNLVDDFTWTKGNHTIQFGGNLRIINDARTSFAQSFNDGLANVGFLFKSAIANTGGSLDPAAFGFPAVDSGFAPQGYDPPITALAGLVSEFDAIYNRTKTGSVLAEGTPVQRHFRAFEFEPYIQDQWRIKPNLTLTYGLRYSLLQPPYETTGTQVAPTTSLDNVFNTRAADQVKGISFNPLITFDLAGQANGKQPYWGWDYKDVAPRVALAWSPDFESGFLRELFGGPGKVVIRGGWGLYFDHFGEGIINTFDRQGSFGLTTDKSNAAGILTVDNVPRYVNENTIPAALLPLAPPPAGGFPATPISNPITGFAITWGLDDHLKTPYSHAVNFSITRELGHNFTIEAAYVGNFGRRLLQQIDLAMPLDLTDPKSGMDYFKAATLFSQMGRANTDLSQVQPIPFWQDVFPTAAGLPPIGCAPNSTGLTSLTATQEEYDLWDCFLLNETSALQIADTQCNSSITSFPVACPTVNGVTGPFQFYSGQFSSLYAWNSIGSSDYNAMQIILRKRMSYGLQFGLNYTLSKSLDAGSDAERVSLFEGFGFGSQIINSWSPKQLRGLSDFNTTHQLNANWIWEVPVGKGKAFASQASRGLDALIGGWEISGLGRWTSGFPFSVGNSFDFPTNFELTGNAIPSGTTLPKTGTFFVPAGPGLPPTINEFQNPQQAQSFFTNPFPGQSGVRNNLIGPGYFGVDMSLQKSWNLGETRQLRFGWDTFNVTNSVRFDAATSASAFLGNSGAFGNYSATLTDARKMQFWLRFQF